MFDSLKINNELRKKILTIVLTFLEVLDKHAPLTRKLLTANHASYITKSFQKVIMGRSYLEKVYFKNRIKG